MLLGGELNTNVIYLYANTAGDIVYYGGDNIRSDIKRCCEMGADAIIEGDCFSKISMKKCSPRFVNTRIEGYRHGIIASFGNGIAKRYEIVLLADDVFFYVEGIMDKLQRVNSILADSKDERAEISVLHQTNEALKDLTALYKTKDIRLINNICQDERAVMEPYFSKIIIMSVIYMLLNTNGSGDISVYSSDTEYGKKLDFSVTNHTVRPIRGICDFCNEYPRASAISFFARAICNEKGIELSIDCTRGTVEISLVFPRAEIKEFSVYNRFTAEMSDELYRILSDIFNHIVK